MGEANNKNGGRIRISGLWREKATNGQEYLSGSLGSFKVLIFPVREKKGPNGPDFELFLTAAEKQQTVVQSDFPGGGEQK